MLRFIGYLRLVRIRFDSTRLDSTRVAFNGSGMNCGFQVSNWFINARVRLWKPMVEEMYQQEAKDESGNEQSSGSAQTPTPPPPTTASAAANTNPPPPPPPRNVATAQENDPSYIAMNRQCSFTDNHAKPPMNHPNNMASSSSAAAAAAAASSSAAARNYPAMQESDACHDQQSNADIGSTLIRFGTNSGDVSLTLGLRHAGNLPEKSPFSVRDFGGC